MPRQSLLCIGGINHGKRAVVDGRYLRVARMKERTSLNVTGCAHANRDEPCERGCWGPSYYEEAYEVRRIVLFGAAATNILTPTHYDEAAAMRALADFLENVER